MRVWIRTSEPTAFRILYDRTTTLTTDSPSVTSKTHAAADNTGYADLIDLTGAKTYWYAIELDGKIIRRFHGDAQTLNFRTWPSERSFHHPLLNPRGLANTTIAVAVCNHINNARQKHAQKSQSPRHHHGACSNRLPPPARKRAGDGAALRSQPRCLSVRRPRAK
jgi:sulfur carrier protein ThiS